MNTYRTAFTVFRGRLPTHLYLISTPCNIVNQSITSLREHPILSGCSKNTSLFPSAFALTVHTKIINEKHYCGITAGASLPKLLHRCSTIYESLGDITIMRPENTVCYSLLMRATTPGVSGHYHLLVFRKTSHQHRFL